MLLFAIAEATSLLTPTASTWCTMRSAWLYEDLLSGWSEIRDSGILSVPAAVITARASRAASASPLLKRRSSRGGSSRKLSADPATTMSSSGRCSCHGPAGRLWEDRGDRGDRGDTEEIGQIGQI